MSFAQVALAQATTQPQPANGDSGLAPVRPHPRIDAGHKSSLVFTPETRPEQAELPGPPKTNLAAPAKSAAVEDLTPTQTAQRLMEWSTAKSILSGHRLVLLGLMAGV